MIQEPTEKRNPLSFRALVLIALSLLFLFLGIIMGALSEEEGNREKAAKRFERVLHHKERFLTEEFNKLEEEAGEQPIPVLLEQESARYLELASKQGISIFYYERGTLKYWSDNSIPLPDSWWPRLVRPYLSLRNADYVTVYRQLESGRLVGLIEVKTHFPFENEFLVNGFQKDFKLDEGVGIEILEANGTRPVYNQDGAYLFALNFTGVSSPDPHLRDPAIAAWFLFLGFLLAGMYTMAAKTLGTGRWVWIGVASLVLSGSVVSILRFSFPPQLFNAQLFQPEIFASQNYASLGALLVVTVAVLVFVLQLYRWGKPEKHLAPVWRTWAALLLFCLAGILLLYIDHLIRILVLDSGISYEVHKVTVINGYTVVGLLVIIMWLVILGLFMDQAVKLYHGSMAGLLLRGGAVLTATVLASRLITGNYGDWITWAAAILLLGSFIYLRTNQTGRIHFSRFVFILLFVSVYMVIRLQENNKINVERQKEVELVKLSSEHDPVAEMLFSEMSMAVRNDSVFAYLISRPDINIDRIMERLSRSYLSGYWSKYELQVIVCRPGDQLYVEPPEDESYPCYDFFDEMISEQGIQIPGSDFYFLDNLNGRISYLAAIPFYQGENEHRLIIELDSKIYSEELGYPELLLDDNYTSLGGTDYSYAKYNKGILITQEGDFPYRRSSAYYTEGKEMFETIREGRYDHSIYNVDGENTIIVGSPMVTTVDHLISFSYIFSLNFLLLAFAYLLFSVRFARPYFQWSFKNRIQYSMVGILFLTFALICAGTIYFIVKQYRVRNYDSLRNTMRSVYVDLIHRVESEEDLKNWSSDEFYNLDELLIRFSNVFYTDINLYDKQGSLLATSRQEIFDRQLMGRNMNRMVFENLSGGNASEVIHNEHIGKLRYISAYVPLLNSKNQFLAYLNLPYFTRSEELTRDVTNLVVAVINIYMILMLVILLLSVFLADRITQPLRMIQERIAQVSLSEKNEMIRYDRSDEIRGLVEEYNYMVQELERSAGLLAQSERESAWREMAKQIAHEIKNPLTPMKLNVQHLQRTLEEEKGDPERVGRIASTLIEQIDSLSAIAREFSDFAKMPKPKNARINLVTQLKNLLQLFENSERATFDLDLGERGEAFVFADKEQLMRVFINLVKNGLQSIPEQREGTIGIGLRVQDHHVRVTISDNGKGIPEEIRDRLFQPNFTTKSRGMGMGLAISHNIIRSLGGRIWFETVLDQGTTFFVELPEWKEKS